MHVFRNFNFFIDFCNELLINHLGGIVSFLLRHKFVTSTAPLSRILFRLHDERLGLFYLRLKINDRLGSTTSFVPQIFYFLLNALSVL